MELYYQGVDITYMVDIAKCIHHEASGGRCDCLEIEMDHAGAWYSWGPKTDDVIVASMNGYQTGTLYLNTIIPQNGKFRILATSVPSAARRKTCATYENIRLNDLLASCAAECGMESGLYGLDGQILYPFLMRNAEGAAAFMNRIADWEGAAFKTVGGRFAGISILQMQKASATQNIEISAEQPGVTYIRRDDLKWSALTIKTPYAECIAQDNGASNGNYVTMTHLPAMNDVEAGRWARGLLLSNNRKAERLTISMEFNAGFAAMTRVDVSGSTDASGEWIIDEVEHDMIGRKSTATLFRCIDTIR